MRRLRPFTPDDLAGPPSGPRERTIEPSTADPHEHTTAGLYAEHWRYVQTLLLGCGIPAQDAGDVAQTVWMHVHRRRDSYDASMHKTPRAWITGFVVRCAASHRRTQRRRPLVLMEDSGDLLAALGLDPEQTAILWDLHRLIPNEDQRIALLLRVQHGLTVAEIAAVQEVTESAVEWRLRMARRNVKNGDDEKSSSAYLGFGSLEALAEALKPRPIPDEVGRRQWEQIAERIRQEEASPNDTVPPTEPSPSEPPSSLSPVAALPALASPTVPALVALETVKLAALLFFACVSGAAAGAGSVAAWQAHETGRHGRATSAMDAAPMASAPTVPSSPSVAPSTRIRPAAVAAPSTAPSSTPAARAAPSSSTRPAAPSSTPATPSTAPSSTSAASAAPSGATLDEGESRRLLSRMRDSMIARQFSMVLSLADQHARQFRTTHVREREALRIEALRETGRTKDAEQQARAVIATHPEHRGAMERSAGRALP